MSNIEIATTFSRLFIQIYDENRLKRKEALEKIFKDVTELEFNSESDFYICSKVIHAIFDIGERNREITCEILSKIINRQTNLSEFLTLLIPELTKKLGDKDNIEPSEEIRYNFMQICLSLVEKSGKLIAIFNQEILKICCNTLSDNYSEIKRITCFIINAISQLNDHGFYTNSEQLIKPLIANLCHQHSRVRLDMVNCIGYVLLNNNAKSFDIICSNLAQRLFDDNSNVRKAVIEVFGKWLLDLTDRYSFHTKLIPVFLTGYIDEVEEIRSITSDLWYDIGMKYQHENENDLKDQIDFEDLNLTHYPREYERPNLGCRVLLFRTMSRILPALTRDLSDWSENTRIKAAKLLPYLIINCESACTQHCQLFIGSTLIRGLVDDEVKVRQACRESSRLLGYFIEPKVWWHILQTVINRQEVDETFLAGELILLSCIIESSDCECLIRDNIIQSVCDYLKSEDICGSFSTKIKLAGLRCLLSIVTRFNEQYIEIYETIGYNIFYTAMSFSSYESQDCNDEVGQNLNEQLQIVFNKFTESIGFDNHNDLFRKFCGSVISELIPRSHHWLAYSSDRFLCSKLLLMADSIVGEFVDPIMSLIEIVLNKSQELELRLKFFLTLVKLTSNINVTLNSQGEFQTKHLERLLDSIILPNLTWQSGRTAEALRRVSITCLWSTLIGCCKSSNETSHPNIFASLPATVWHELLVRQVAVLDDDLKDTRMTSAKSLVISFDIIKQYGLVEKQIVNDDYLHTIYPQFIKRMDDSVDEIRIMAAKIIESWTGVLMNRFEANLYRAHIEDLNSGILIHLDDLNRDVQLATFDTLKAISRLSADIAISEINKVRNKHRSPKYCDDLIAEIRSITQ